MNGIKQADGTIKALSPKQVADLLGHSTSQITEMYYVKKDTSRLNGILGEYKGSSIPIQVKCLQCGRIWDALPKELSKGVGCSFCYHKKRTDSQDEFINKLNGINENIKVLGIYAGRKKRIHVKCKICGKEWEPLANNLLMGKGCPHCAGRKK